MSFYEYLLSVCACLCVCVSVCMCVSSSDGYRVLPLQQAEREKVQCMVLLYTSASCRITNTTVNARRLTCIGRAQLWQGKGFQSCENSSETRMCIDVFGAIEPLGCFQERDDNCLLCFWVWSSFKLLIILETTSLITNLHWSHAQLWQGRDFQSRKTAVKVGRILMYFEQLNNSDACKKVITIVGFVWN